MSFNPLLIYTVSDVLEHSEINLTNDALLWRELKWLLMIKCAIYADCHTHVI